MTNGNSRGTKKETTNIHYLKSVPAPAATNKDTARTASLSMEEVESKKDSQFTDLMAGLEKRMDRIENEFRGAVAEMKKGRPQQQASDFSSLVKNLEDHIQTMSDDLKNNLSPKGSRQLIVFLELLKRMKRAVDPAVYKDILKSLWFGPSQKSEDNYEVDEFGMDPAFVKQVKPFFDFLYYNYWRVSVEGLQHIPSEGGGLIVANHSGTLPYDGSMIGAAVANEHPSRRDVRFLVEDFVYHFPFLGTFMYRIGGVRACQENAERLLTRGHLVTVFPEGVKGIGKLYKERYRLQRFGRGGFIKLALRTRSPIIPTAVIGAEEIHPLLYKSTILARPFGIPYIPLTPTLPLLGPAGLLPLPSKWTIVFDEPIALTEYGPEAAEDQLLVNKLSEMVRGRIQNLVTEALKKRRSVWFG